MNSEKKYFLKISLFIICLLGVVVAWLGFGEQGLIPLYRTDKERQIYVEKIRLLTEENQALIEEVKRLRTDLKYIESVARKEFNLIKPNEVIYKFSTDKPEKKRLEGK